MAIATSLLDSAGEAVVHRILDKHRDRFAVHMRQDFSKIRANRDHVMMGKEKLQSF